MIKHFFFCVAFCCASLSINAQTEFAPIGAEWIFTPIMENTLNFNPLAQWTSVKSTGDSVIGGQTFRKVGYNLLFFQEDAQVFLFFKDSLYQVLDFGVDVGDSLYLYTPVNVGLGYLFEGTEMNLGHFRVDSIRMLPTTTGQTLKKFYLRNLDLSWGSGIPYYFEYMENVGDLSWLIGESAVHHSDVPSWLRCYRDSTLEFHSERLISLGATDCLDSTTSVRQPYLSNITTAPNPVTDQFRINLGSEEISLLVVTDLAGKTVHRRAGTQTGVVPIDCASWHRGVYLCYAQSGEQWLWCKVVK